MIDRPFETESVSHRNAIVMTRSNALLLSCVFNVYHDRSMFAPILIPFETESLSHRNNVIAVMLYCSLFMFGVVIIVAPVFVFRPRQSQ